MCACVSVCVCVCVCESACMCVCVCERVCVCVCVCVCERERENIGWCSVFPLRVLCHSLCLEPGTAVEMTHAEDTPYCQRCALSPHNRHSERHNSSSWSLEGLEWPVCETGS